MATFPSSVKLGWRDTGEKPEPVVLRGEVERGPARQRRMAADSLVTVPLTAYFDTAAESAAFETWFFGDAAAGAAWFDFTLPRTGQVVQARVVNGDIGQLKPSTKTWAFSERSFQLEYIRPGFVQLAPGLYDIEPSRILSVQRASTATYIDDAGMLQTAAANTARYQGGQLLVEGAATNTTRQSQNLNSAPWVGCARSLAAEFWAGNVPFFEVAKLLTTEESAISNGFAVAANETWTMTIALLAGTKNTCTVGFFGSVNQGSPGFWGAPAECSKEIISGPGVFTTYAAHIGGLWHVDGLSPTVPTLLRITRTFTAAMNAQMRLYPGRAQSTTIGDSVKATRVQTEQGSDDTSYILTTTAAVTRAADLITVLA